MADYPPNGIEMDLSHEVYRAMRAKGVRWEHAVEMPYGWRCHGLVSGPAFLYASEVERQSLEAEELAERHAEYCDDA